jgi:hypothetical protein
VQDYGVQLIQPWPVHDGMVERILILLACEHVHLGLNVVELPRFYSSVYMLTVVATLLCRLM